jgi:hypothetical protein
MACARVIVLSAEDAIQASTRTYGSVGGAEPRGSPLSRSVALFGHGALSGASPEFASNRTSLPSSLIDLAPASAAPRFSLPDGSNTRSTWRFSTNTKRLARRAMRGARPDCGLSHTGDSVRGPERRPRQRSGFGEEFPPKPLGKSPNRDQAART